MESVPRAVATGSHLLAKSGSNYCYPVATALGTDLIIKLGHYFLFRSFLTADQRSLSERCAPLSDAKDQWLRANCRKSARLQLSNMQRVDHNDEEPVRVIQADKSDREIRVNERNRFGKG